MSAISSGPSASGPGAVPTQPERAAPQASLRLAATLLLAGQLLFIAVGLFHPDGDANDHPAVFAEYAASGSWKVVHLGQFVGMAILLAGLVVLCSTLSAPAGARAGWAGRLGAAAAVAALALYGVLQAVDGVALDQAVTAWVGAAPADKAARFATAETVRWLEWGVRSYQDFTLGLALLLAAAAVAVAGSAWIPRPIAPLIGLAGLAHLVQGWVVGAEGFSPAESIPIVAGFVLDLAWMIWLCVAAWRMREPPRG